MALASAIANIPHLKAFETMAETAFALIDKTIVLMYIIDLAPVDALPYLAEQLDVLGWKGWLFADTEAKKRELLKKAILLHKKKGTAFAIREALLALNTRYERVEIIKVAGKFYDGSFDYDGSEDYAGGFWAHFIVRIYVPFNFTIDATEREIARKLIQEYKNERSKLVVLEYWKNLAIAQAYVFEPTLSYPPDIPQEGITE